MIFFIVFCVDKTGLLISQYDGDRVLLVFGLHRVLFVRENKYLFMNEQLEHKPTDHSEIPS